MSVPLTFNNLSTPPTALEWFTRMLTIANTVGLPTTTWQPGGVERSVFNIVANVRQEADVAGSIIAQAGFLDFAASGTVTYTDADGAVVTLYVTPDPSIPAQNPDGTLGWLDVLADSVYDVQRIITSYAGGALAILNTSASTYGPFSAGTYHVGQPAATGSPTYVNTASLSIAPSATVDTVAGTADDGGLVEITTSGSHGLTTGDTVYVDGVGGTTEANGAWVVTVTSATTFDLDGSVYANSYTSGGTVYTPTTATFVADVSGSASDAEINTVTQAVTSLIGVSVSNVDAWIGNDTESNVALAARCKLKLQALAVGATNGAYVYYALLAQTLAPDLTPAQTVSAAITRARVDLDVTSGTSYITIANASGGPGTSDVNAVQAVEDAYVGVITSNGIVQAAANKAVTIAITIYLPTQYNTTANNDYFTAAVLSYARSVDIGGITNPGGVAPNTNVFPYDSTIASVYTAAQTAQIPIQDVDGTLNSGTANIQLALTPVPEVAVPSVTITLVSV